MRPQWKTPCTTSASQDETSTKRISKRDMAEERKTPSEEVASDEYCMTCCKKWSDKVDIATLEVLLRMNNDDERVYSYTLLLQTLERLMKDSRHFSHMCM